ncbi:NAD(P)H-dependent oxidoreductase [Oscillospiraceae bacterium CM]|nr:NAD(P)H-dependent oxidoreductase [Oscillospiraceae bacterium CM]
MKIGIIVYSKTGKTLSVAKKLKEALLSSGNYVLLEQVTTAGDDLSKVAAAPGTEGYDAVILASPVWGLSLASVMKLYLDKIPSLKGQKVGLFVTRSFWGGKGAIKQMAKVCQAKGGTVSKTGMVSASGDNVKKLIEDFKSL